nr:hypothetical protein [Tanacetum cinerariifolium]
MDPNSSLRKICLGDDVVVISMARLKDKEIGSHPNIKTRLKKLVKKELIVALKGELYFVKFIINPEEDDSEPGVILGRSFLRLAHGVVDFSYGEAKKEAFAVMISQNFALLEEERSVIKTMADNDIYKNILNEIWKDKVKLDGKTMKEEEDVVKRIKGEALKEKEDPGAFIFPIREEMKKFDRGITMINHTQAEAMGKLSNVLCQVEVCHQTFQGARFDVLRTAESDSDDEEEYVIKRNSVWKKAVSFLGSFLVPLKQVNWKPDYKGSYTKEEEATRQWRMEIRLTDPYGNIYLQGFTT